LDYSELIQDLKRKKELKDLEDNFILFRIKDYLQDNKVPSNKKSKEYRKIFKDLRRILRKTYGMFRVIKEKRDLNFYKSIFNKLKPKKILDLGCGLEPLYYTKLVKAEFYATDISKNIVNEINICFKKNKIKGKAFVFNLVDEDLSKLPKVDLCLMLKLLESLELIKRDISKDILKKINSKYILVTFAKKALGKKITIRKSGRSWFRRMLKDLGYEYEIIDYEDEILFLIEKTSLVH